MLEEQELTSLAAVLMSISYLFMYVFLNFIVFKSEN